jgi:endonuclease G
LKQLQLNWKLDRITRFGLPYPVAGHLTIHPGWIGAYDCTRKNPLWVAHMVSASDFQKPASKEKPSRSNSQFYADPTLPVHLRAAPADYTKSGYDRGHLIPAADLKHLSQDALDETFNMANVCPQVGAGFNRNYWARLEELTRKLVRDGDFAEALVCTGPLYLPQRRSDGRLFVEYECIGEGGRVAVPTHFFKIILAERTVPSFNNAPLHLAAFILPNGPIDEYVSFLFSWIFINTCTAF